MPAFEPITLATFRDRTGIASGDLLPSWHEVGTVVALRDLVSVEHVQSMTVDYLSRLVRNVTLAGDDSVRPYQDCEVRLLRIDPDAVRSPQTFVERSKYQRIVEDVSDLLGGFCQARGIAKRTASVIIGRNAEGQRCLAHYLPPLVEESQGRMRLLDGTHRCFLVRAVGTTIESVLIRGVTVPFPCEPQNWRDVRKVDAKPPLEERFAGLNPALFRNVKHIGIDG